MRFHVVALPHTQTTAAFSACAFTWKVRGFAHMMKSLGHTVYIYASEQCDAPCDELVTCISQADQEKAAGDLYIAASFNSSDPHWRAFNAAAIDGIKRRAAPDDFICVIGGTAHQPIAGALPHMMTVEFGIGYAGTFAKYRVFESYAWMHAIYGAATGGNAQASDGLWFDDVIPSYFDPADFPFRHKKDDYLLFVGRMIERKGINVAVEVAKATGRRLIMAGPGTPPAGVEYAGTVGPVERGRLMAGAHAFLMPTTYVEPFGTVAIEAMACGTPVLSTDWGAMTETVVQGVTGFRCRTLQEFCDGVAGAALLDPAAIRRHAVATYSLDVVRYRYQRYFERLASLWGAGWYARRA